MTDKIIQYHVDAFARQVFKGNPAAVCPLTAWLDDELMQQIAAENNLAETAFFVPEGKGFAIRWFTPVAEVDLCGHATLASASVLYNQLGYTKDSVTFDSRSGPLTVRRNDELFEMDFPSQRAEVCGPPSNLSKAIGVNVHRCLYNEDYLVVLESEQALQALSPNFNKLLEVEARGVIVTAPSKEYDFVCRFFAPRLGINEDPVTGSAFTKLIPFWADELSKNVLNAKQISERGGEVVCELQGERVKISGHSALFAKGEVYI